MPVGLLEPSERRQLLELLTRLRSSQRGSPESARAWRSAAAGIPAAALGDLLDQQVAERDAAQPPWQLVIE